MSQPQNRPSHRAGGPPQAPQAGSNPLARNSPRGPMDERVRSQERPRTALSREVCPPRAAGSARQQPDDQFSTIQKYWEDNPQTARMQSVDQKVLVSAQQILRDNPRLPPPARTFGLGARFNFELANVSLQPNGNGLRQEDDVMKSLFHVPVVQTMFEVPEYTGPLGADSVPKWFMSKRNSPDFEERKGKISTPAILFDLLIPFLQFDMI